MVMVRRKYKGVCVFVYVMSESLNLSLFPSCF